MVAGENQVILGASSNVCLLNPRTTVARKSKEYGGGRARSMAAASPKGAGERAGEPLVAARVCQFPRSKRVPSKLSSWSSTFVHKTCSQQHIAAWKIC